MEGDQAIKRTEKVCDHGDKSECGRHLFRSVSRVIGDATLAIGAIRFLSARFASSEAIVQGALEEAPLEMDATIELEIPKEMPPPGQTGLQIRRITPGSLPTSEEASLVQTLGHIDAGTTPGGAIAKKWGSQFKNWDGDLPGGKGPTSPYLEYRVAPPAGTNGAGPLRVVVNGETGEMYYTWTHYGDAGAPAFVQIR